MPGILGLGSCGGEYTQTLKQEEIDVEYIYKVYIEGRFCYKVILKVALKPYLGSTVCFFFLF